MDAIISTAGPLRGTLTPPPDKSVCHRAVLAAAIADGGTEISPWPNADDCQRTLEVVERLGAHVTRSSGVVAIRGLAGRLAQSKPGVLFCGESGTTLRLSAGLLAGQQLAATLDASPSLRARPMRRIVEPLTAMGAQISGEGRAEGRDEVYPPLNIRGARPLRPIRYEMPLASAQVKSAILFAGLSASGPTTVVEQVPTRDHTERMLRRFGARVTVENGAVTVTPGSLRAPERISLPGDLSSAAFLIVAALCVPGSLVTLERVGLNPSRSGFLDVLRRMGALLRIGQRDDAWEPQAQVSIASAPLSGVTVGPEEIPGLIDELPVLMVAACCARGTTRLLGVGELRVKETDRIRSMVTGLLRLGARIDVRTGADIQIQGGALRGSMVESAEDHRTAMSLAVAGLVAQGGPTRIQGVECIAKSYPGFLRDLGSLTGSATVKTVDKAGRVC